MAAMLRRDFRGFLKNFYFIKIDTQDIFLVIDQLFPVVLANKKRTGQEGLEMTVI